MSFTKVRKNAGTKKFCNDTAKQPFAHSTHVPLNEEIEDVTNFAVFKNEIYSAPE